MFGENASPLSVVSPGESDSRILVVILANQYDLKKYKKLFDNLADEDAMAELSGIYGLEI